MATTEISRTLEQVEPFGKSRTAKWAAQQVVEAFPWATPPKYLLRDRDGMYGEVFRTRAANMALEEVLIAPRSHWQNPSVERLIGSIRRDYLDHVIAVNEWHLMRILKDYFRYDHRWRTHRSLELDCPGSQVSVSLDLEHRSA